MKILILYNEDKYIELSMDQSYCFNEKLEQVRQGDIHIVSVNGEPVINHMTCEEFSNTNAFHIKAYELEAKEYAVSTVYLSEVSIGNDQDCNIIVDQEEPLLCVLSKRQLCFYEGRLYRNGVRLRPGTYDLWEGDCLFTGKVKFTVTKDQISVMGEGCLVKLNEPLDQPEQAEGFPVYKRSPRIIKRVPSEQVEIQKPASKEEQKKGELFKRLVPPLCTLGMTIGVSILMKRGLFVLMSAGTMVVTIVFSVVSYFEDKKDRKEKEVRREANYEKYLLEKRKQIKELYDQQIEAMNYHYPSVPEIERMTEVYSSRIYERSVDDGDFLTLSLGRTDIKPGFSVKFQEDMDVEDPLYEDGKVLAAEYRMVKQVPAVIDLKCAHLGLVGDKTYIHRMLMSIIPQICFLQSYHDVEIVAFIEEEDAGTFSWMTWYPHCRIKAVNVKSLVYMENHNEQILASLTQILKGRKQMLTEGKKDTIFMPHYIIIIDNPKLVINNSIMEYLQSNELNLGFSIIYSTNQQSNLPENIKTIVQVEGIEFATLLMNEGSLVRQTISLADIQTCNLERMARKMAALEHSKGVSNRIPDSITFFDLYHAKRPEDIPVSVLWRQNCCFKSLAVPLGVRATDDIVYLNLHEKAHGPHGLVAGTTGSGKSEILQSLILSLAVNFHPYDVGFLLIDYKGGGMANLFRNMPHLLGTITNLDGSESMRALASIKSELARRQRVFNESDVNNINDYTKLFKGGKVSKPLPHLFLISDEFAELKHEQPEFMSELVSTARIGRSLGVHLILATQKPSGVVDDQIWSNSKFKLALKVQNESDSNEVLKTPDAARITQAGRAYLQVGNNEIYELFQSAWSGADYSEHTAEKGFDDRVYEKNALGQKTLLTVAEDEEQETIDVMQTQLDAVVDHIAEVYKGTGSVSVDKPWLPSLETHLVTPHIRTDIDVGSIPDYHLAVPVGMVDIPEEQRQEEYIHDFASDGNMAIFSAAGFGKSTAIMNMALSMAANNSPEKLNYFILDMGNSALIQLKELPHTADYLTFDDIEKMSKLVKLLTDEMKKRKVLFARTSSINFEMYNEVAQEKLPALVVFIDNYDVIKELEVELEPFLIKLTRDGIGIGIYTVITASRSNAVRYAVLNNFKNKIAMFLFEETEARSIVGRSNYKLPEVKGRAYVKLEQVSIMQMYLPADGEGISYSANIASIVKGIKERNTAARAEGIRVLPEVVTYEMLEKRRKDRRQVLLGLDSEEVMPYGLDLAGNIYLVVGASQTGKTNVLRLIYQQEKGKRIFVVDSRGEDLQDCENDAETVYCGSEAQMMNFYEALKAEVEQRKQSFEADGQNMRLKEYCKTLAPMAVLIEDGDYFIDLCKGCKKEMEALIPQVLEYGITIVVATLPGKLRGFDDITKLLKESQSGVVLGQPEDQSILRMSAPRRYKAQVDIGFWYQRGDFKQIKIPLV